METFYALLYGFQVLSLVIAGALMVVGSPYGSQTQYHGRLAINGKFAWIIMELASPLALLSAYTSRHIFGDFLVSLWLLHYLHRAVIYPLRQPSRKPMHLGIMLSAILFNILNGYLNGHWLAHYAPESYGKFAWGSPSVLAGLGLFMVGMAGNIHHDNILMNVRVRRGSSAYAVPRGGLFEVVSCPHFLCEIVEWFGFAALSGSPAAWAFCLNVVCNLVPRAYFIHKWYRTTFTNYPQTRRAIVPYLL
ncbi:hypothetical protein H4R22_000625 [Coemansia sp. RSA 1290]|nr:3-oxo-5-alpha-steroid 4-dehydrogenase-domain-containing protein [Coemansia mojavensis]KAJ1750056.1 hypothetical protein LPJ79_003229 [Coemansia sp. RSA 1821]KAJ1872001.1 hypothetical protein LPJ55_003450 [Coemansia sp. RSA 990]KAJ2633258.1 hypothetical protein H4R22_000625 [Coemansia sp. RSA 1290]